MKNRVNFLFGLGVGWGGGLEEKGAHQDQEREFTAWVSRGCMLLATEAQNAMLEWWNLLIISALFIFHARLLVFVCKDYQ